MKDEAIKEDELVRYLLGQLPEDEQQQIEQRAFADDGFYGRLLEVEDDLRCAYAQGTLPLAEKQQFEKRFLIFADERKRVELARAMIAELPAAQPVLRASSQFDRRTGLLGRSLTVPGAAIRFAMAAAALILVAALVWLLFDTARLRNQIQQLQSERVTTEEQRELQSAEERARIEQLGKQLEAERNLRAEFEDELAAGRGQTTESQRRPSVVALLLSAGRLRGGGETKRLILPQGVDEVRLQLELTGDVSSVYRAVVMNSEGREIWTRTALKPRRDGTRPVISFGIPARILAEDDFELRLTGLDNEGQPERTDSYYFTVLKK